MNVAPDIKVLVAGFNHAQNPYMHNLKKYADCRPEWSGENRSSAFAKDADIVIIVESNILRDKRRAIIDHYSLAKKPIIKASGRGFSEVAISFESVLQDVREKKRAAVGNLLVPRKWVVNEKKGEETKPMQKPKREYDEKAVYAVIEECHSVNMSAKEIADYLNLEGWTRPRDAQPFDQMDIYYRISTINRRAAKKAGAKPAAAAAPAAATLSAAPKVDMPQKPQVNQLELIGRVIAADALNEKEKLDIIARINRGEIVTDEWTEKRVEGNFLKMVHCSLSTPPEGWPQLTVSKKTAALILNNVATIHQFFKEGTV